MTLLRIGTRKSQLALWQAEYVREALIRQHSGLEVELVKITTEGDRVLDVPLAQVGGKGMFLKELEQALLDERIDLAVHSMKDVTVTLPDGLDLPVICERADVRDAFVSNRYDSLDQLPAGARVGTCSLRRQSILRHHYPNLAVENLRGNVNTRLKRLDDGEYDAIILAVAGLQRLDMGSRIKAFLSVDEFLPAVGQGAVGIECRQADETTLAFLQPLNHAPTQARVRAERAANERLGGGCHVPVAAFAEIEDQILSLRAWVGRPDGASLLQAAASGSSDMPETVGYDAAEQLLQQGAGEILQAVYAEK